MGYEMDYIPVGNGESSGDAILFRYGNLFGPRPEQTVVVIDGGFTESGEKIVKHLNQYYGTNSIDLVICTHPDSDHASGLLVVLEKCNVANLLLHKPWEHAEEIKVLFKDNRITSSGLEDKLEKSLQHAKDLETLAIKKGIKIFEPFEGLKGFSDTMLVLGPSEDYYRKLIALFRSTPDPIEALTKLLAPVKEAATNIINWIEDKLDIDLLNDDEDKTSAENNSSSIVLFNIEGHKILFTGDAGKTGLLLAEEYAQKNNISLSDLKFFDIPHHGSKRNLSSRVLNKINGEVAYISASGDNPKHPAKKVTNALRKKGMRIYVNRKNTLHHHINAPDRPGWSNILEEPWHEKVEE